MCLLISHLRRRVVVVFALVFLVAMTTTKTRILRQQTAIVECQHSLKVYDDGYESKKHANSHVSVAPPVMLELSSWSWSRVRDRFRVALPLGSRAFKCQRRALSSRARRLAELRTWSNGCGMRAEERLLLLNHGRDAAAFYDYAAWRYDAPPQAVAFLHGHGALAWHTSCETVFTRVTASTRVPGSSKRIVVDGSIRSRWKVSRYNHLW